jgi:hypothetical protein
MGGWERKVNTRECFEISKREHQRASLFLLILLLAVISKFTSTLEFELRLRLQQIKENEFLIKAGDALKKKMLTMTADPNSRVLACTSIMAAAASCRNLPYLILRPVNLNMKVSDAINKMKFFSFVPSLARASYKWLFNFFPSFAPLVCRKIQIIDDGEFTIAILLALIIAHNGRSQRDEWRSIAEGAGRMKEITWST